MRCPTCKGELRPWPWQDGGFKGVQCDACKNQWWSDAFSTAAYEVEQAAVRELMKRSDFPEDAIIDADFQRQLSLKLQPPPSDGE